MTGSASLEGRRLRHLSRILRGPLRGHLRMRNTDEPSHSRDASAPELCHARPNTVIARSVSDEGKNKKKKRRQNADRRVSYRPHQRMRRALKSAARSPVGVPPRRLLQRPNATAQLQIRASWDVVSSGVTRLRPVPVQRASRRPVMVPAGRMSPEPPGSGGDEPPPAGTALAPPTGVIGWRPSRERDSLYGNRIKDECQDTIPVLATHHLVLPALMPKPALVSVV
jgi:hypothetical protein